MFNSRWSRFNAQNNFTERLTHEEEIQPISGESETPSRTRPYRENLYSAGFLFGMTFALQQMFHDFFVKKMQEKLDKHFNLSAFENSFSLLVELNFSHMIISAIDTIITSNIENTYAITQKQIEQEMRHLVIEDIDPLAKKEAQKFVVSLLALLGCIQLVLVKELEQKQARNNNAFFPSPNLLMLESSEQVEKRSRMEMK